MHVYMCVCVNIYVQPLGPILLSSTNELFCLNKKMLWMKYLQMSNCLAAHGKHIRMLTSKVWIMKAFSEGSCKNAPLT